MKRFKKIGLSTSFFIIVFLSPFISINCVKTNDTNQLQANTIDNTIIESSISNSIFNNFANLTGHGWRVREVAFSPIAPILASGSSDGTIRLWNLTDGKILHVLNRHHYGIITLDFSPSGEMLASGGIDNKINLWNVSSGEHLNSWSMFPHGVIDIKWSPDGKTLAVGGGEWMVDVKQGNQPDKLLRLLNASTGEVLRNFTGHSDSISSVAFSKNGSRLISGSWDKSIRLWDVSSGLELRSYANHNDKITSITFSNEETIIISGSLDKTVKLWNVSTGNIIHEISIGQSIWSIALSPDDSTLAVAIDPSLTWPDRYWLTFGEMHNCSIQLWNISDRIIINTLTGHRNTIESVKFSMDGTILASASWDWTVKLWGDHPSLTVDKPIDEWPTSSLEEQNINSTRLYQNLDWLNNLDYHNLHSLLVIRSGKLVFEKYFYDDECQEYTRELKHTHFSATKSFSSAMIGIAIDKGFIQDTEQFVLDFFPEKTFNNIDSRKEAMTLHHLLTMTTGMEWDDQTDFWEGLAVSEDSVEYVLSKPMIANPGSEYNYNSGASQILSAIIEETTGCSTFEFALKYFFEPLGIEESDVVWMAGSDGLNYGGIGLFMTPRNMAKFGQLYLNNGTWDGNQIISSDWITKSSHNHINGLPRRGFVYPPGYGYQFWVSTSAERGDYYFALGYGGQTIQIFPEHDLVIVTTARQDEYNARRISNDIIDSFITDFQQDQTLSQESSVSSDMSGQTSSQDTSWLMLPVVTTLVLAGLIFNKRRGIVK
ncbi:MAG: serine hydrolase [Candidatus Hodarchaeota archaeon]